jgi:hypothetical protein
MSNLEKAARLALDALELLEQCNYAQGMLTLDAEEEAWGKSDEAITALRAALAQQAEPVQAEPVDIKSLAAKAGLPLAWISETGVIRWSQLERLIARAFPLHSSAQQAEPVVEPVELTDAAIEAAITTWFGDHKLDYFDNDEFLDRMRAAIKAAQDFKEAT